jgi:hypothetical protein
MNFVAAMFTGIAITANPASQQPATQQPATSANVVAPMQVASIPQTPDFSVTALSETDVALYLQIMRGAADHIAQANGDDRAAIDYMQATKAGSPGTAPASGETAMLERRAQDLSTYDEKLAEDQGVKARYDAVKGEIEGQGPANPAVQEADSKVVDPHRDEIQSLQNKVRGFMNGR